MKTHPFSMMFSGSGAVFLTDSHGTIRIIDFPIKKYILAKLPLAKSMKTKDPPEAAHIPKLNRVKKEALYA